MAHAKKADKRFSFPQESLYSQGLSLKLKEKYCVCVCVCAAKGRDDGGGGIEKAKNK